ncbi:hypothetical protein Moror_8707 [Moniliophthora roreri MCA 2997]|uniref:F-box domain-containing protein n=2 Tax=Moniliophthora roreri TaxID=221103 RepID=V2YD08_MONRO|nr:hypothetical protein Moror_8707 [Moniliophthora roreri MCA 2997]
MDVDDSNALPRAVLVRIFYERSRLDTPFALPGIISCAGVCRHWRNVAMTTPHLWRNIRVPFRQLHYQERSAVHWTTYWLHLSFPSLIDVYLDVDADAFLPELHAVFHVLVSQAYRLRRFHLYARSNFKYVPHDALAPLHGVHADVLQELELHFAYRASDPDQRVMMLPGDNFVLSFASTPRLSLLALRGVRIPSPLQNLSSLWVENIVPSELAFRDLAVGSPMLQTLVLNMLHPSIRDGNEGMQDVHMPSLRYLTVTYGMEPGIKPESQAPELHFHILVHVVAPQLELLEVGWGDLHHVPDLNLVVPRTNTIPNLHTLRLDYSRLLVSDRMIQQSLIGDSSYFTTLPTMMRRLDIAHPAGKILHLNYGDRLSMRDRVERAWTTL